MAEVLEQVGFIVRILCTFRGMSLAELSAEVGFTRQTMSNKLNGHTKFTFDEILGLADALDVDPRVWFDDPENALSYLRTGRVNQILPSTSTPDIQDDHADTGPLVAAANAA